MCPEIVLRLLRCTDSDPAIGGRGGDLPCSLRLLLPSRAVDADADDDATAAVDFREHKYLNYLEGFPRTWRCSLPGRNGVDICASTDVKMRWGS